MSCSTSHANLLVYTDDKWRNSWQALPEHNPLLLQKCGHTNKIKHSQIPVHGLRRKLMSAAARPRDEISVWTSNLYSVCPNPGNLRASTSYSVGLVLQNATCLISKKKRYRPLIAKIRALLQMAEKVHHNLQCALQLSIKQINGTLTSLVIRDIVYSLP